MHIYYTLWLFYAEALEPELVSNTNLPVMKIQWGEWRVLSRSKVLDENVLNQQQNSSAVHVPVFLMRPAGWKQEPELKVIFQFQVQPGLQEPLLHNEAKAKHPMLVPLILTVPLVSRILGLLH